jgi:uncharacterized protein
MLRKNLSGLIISGMTLSLIQLNETFTIHRLQPDAEIPPSALRSPFFAMARTDDELSLVLPESVKIESERSADGWACFKVEGPLDFNQIGVLAGVSTVLAQAKVSIFALSTFDTDYLLVKREQARAAREALASAGYQVLGGV